MAKKKKPRSKKFTFEEIKVLLSVTDRYYNIINKNSNRDTDVTAKNQAWNKTHQGFNKYCKSSGISVSLFL